MDAPTASRPRVTCLRSESGSSLVEALVAAALVVSIGGGVVHLLIWSRRAVWSAGAETAAVSLAAQKLEQLRALEWRVDSSGTPLSDHTTNLSSEAMAANGTGLQPSPAGAIDRNTPGFFDFVGADGRWLGSGAGPSAGAVYVRRWSIAPLAIDPADSIILTVVVSPLADDAVRVRGRPARGARLQTITTRMAR